jgi:diadenosine tetraphosphatase ApaH/serine/threonine PP2A family protein phosphatase
MMIFDGMGERDFICFGGHSHFPSVWVLGEDDLKPLELEPGKEVELSSGAQKVWANVGSVGQPRDGDPRSSFMTWDTTERKVGYYRVEYDVPTTMNKIRHIPELDNFLADRLESGV